MKIRISLLMLLTVILTKPSQAQFVSRGGDSGFLKIFNASTTLIVLTGNADFDSSLTRAVRKSWTQSNYQEIKLAELNKYLNNPQYSFLTPMWLGSEGALFNKQNEVVKFEGLRLFLGEKGNTKRFTINKDQIIANGFRDVDFDFLSYGFRDFSCEKEKKDMIFRMDHLIKQMNDGLKMAKTLKEPWHSKNDRSYLKVMCYDQSKEMNQQTKRLKGKIVLLPKEYLVDYPDLEKQLKGATFKYQIVNLDEIKSAVKEKKEGYCYVSKYLAQANFGVTNQPCAGLFITETNTGDILFASSELCNTGYFSKPFKGIADDIKDAKY